MKIARLLLFAALLLSAFGTAAWAPDKAAGFVQLVPQPDPASSMASQTHRALQRLMPRLRTLQAAGQIISFEPSLQSGVLKMLYRPSAGLPNLAGRKVYSGMGEAIAAAGLPVGALTCLVPRFQLYLYDIYFESGCLTPGAYVAGSLRDPSGRVTAVASGTVQPDGSLLPPYFDYSGPDNIVRPGYTVTFKEYIGGSLAATFKVKVPAIKFTSMDKAHAILRGTGPAGKRITAEWRHDRWDAGETTARVVTQGTISSAGTWQIDFGAVQLRGSDDLYATVSANPNFAFRARMEVPYIHCLLGSNYCELSGFPLTPATLQMVHAGQTYTFTGTTNVWGWFDAELLTPSAAPIFLVAYDKVSGTGVAQYGLPNLTANIDYTRDAIIGKVPANKYFELWLMVRSTRTWYETYAHSSNAGTYLGNFMATHGVDLVPGEPYAVEVYFVLPTTGNTTDLYKAYGP